LTHINFDIDTAELIEDDPTSRFAYAKIQAFSSGANRHNLICDEETLKKTAPTIYNTPILYNIMNYTGDFGTHTEPGKSMITGFVVPDSAEFEKLPDGRTSLNIVARIFKRYVPKVMELFQKNNGRKVSVEMELIDSQDTGNGLTQMLDFVYTGIQILGMTVKEASPGANIQFLSFSEAKKEFDEALRLEFGKYDDIDFTIPEDVRTNCINALELHKQYGGATSVALASARNMIKNSVISPDRVRNIHKYLDSHKNKPKNKTNPDGAYISYMLHGGDQAYEWSKAMVEKLDSYDNKLSSYFSETVTFPYTSTKDMNPALKGIDPPISLEQANEIARQADAVGADKGGWGIAISSFKKRHKVKDGHWVKMSEEEDKKIGLENPNKEEMSVEENKDQEKKEEMAALPVEDMAAETPAEEKKEDPKEEAKETPDEEKKEQEDNKDAKKSDKKEMSLDSNLDMAAVLAMLDDETEEYRKLADDHKNGIEVNYASLCHCMYAKMCDMTAKYAELEKQSGAYMEENMSLKNFKKSIDEKNFSVIVESVLNEVSDVMSKDAIDNAREDSKNFSLETVDAWKNKTKAIAFSFVKEQKPSKKGFALPYINADQKKERTTFWG
jgi:hypothetical protein